MTHEELRNIVQPYTMASPERVLLLIKLASMVIEYQIPGDFVECGVCNGGSAAILAHFAAKDNRRTWLFDSFEGLPITTIEDKPSANGNTAESEIGKCVGSPEKVFEVIQLAEGFNPQPIVIKGWFDATFPIWKDDVQQIAMLNLDSDWYASEKLCLETWYDKVVDGGFIYLDDHFYWPGSRAAAEDFFKSRGIYPAIHQVGHSAWIEKNART